MDRVTGKMVGIGGSAISSTSGQLRTSAEIEEVRGLSCGALNPEFDAEEGCSTGNVFSERPLMGGKPVCTGSDPAAVRSQTSAGLCVFYCGHHQSMK